MNAKLVRTRLESRLPLRHDRGFKSLEFSGMVNPRFPRRPLCAAPAGTGRARVANRRVRVGAIDLDRPAAKDDRHW